LIRYHASWVVPVAAPPIPNGWIDIHGGRIVAVGAGHTSSLHEQRHLGRVAVLPGLVNAHTHLELSFLHGEVPPSASFNEWVTTMMARRRAAGFAPDAPPVVFAAARAIEQAQAAGTGLVGDVSNTLATVSALREAHMPALLFHELIGFNLADVGGRVRSARAAIDAAPTTDDIRVTIAPHAPYSVSPALFGAIRDDVNAHAPSITTVHLGESEPELELLRSGTGVVRAMLERLGAWSDDWRAPGCSPVEYLAELGFLDAQTLVVHGVQFTQADLGRLSSIGATLVSCPRSNVYVGVGSPPLESFYASGVPVAFGTDSLASVDDLNLFSELAEARRIAPAVPASALLESATRSGARALGFETELGTLETGKRARLLAVSIPAHVSDVEEYLVSGVQPEQLRWLAADDHR
jgi:cytosine/adenosine deaminase-related metal-dependent hydrolase